MTDPAAFLAAALAEAEATALDASTQQGPEWTFHPNNIDRALITGSGYAGYAFGDVVSYDEGAPSEHQADHIAANDPAHVLRLIAAHRKILGRFQDWDEHFASDPVPPFSPEDHAVMGLLRWTVRALAEAYGWTADA